MPIYAYRCEACGHGRDVLQKMSDAPLTDCPACSAAGVFKKQLTAAGFQLKGSGWYVTDFRGGKSGGGSGTSAPATSSAPASSESSASSASESGSTGSAAPAAACGGGCACH